jgi:hypothetical protein
MRPFWNRAIESNRHIRKNYRDAWIIVVGGVGFIAFFWSCALEPFARGLYRAKLMAVTAEESKAVDADEEGKTIDAKEVQGRGSLHRAWWLALKLVVMMTFLLSVD